jgi:hypothetical protein
MAALAQHSAYHIVNEKKTEAIPPEYQLGYMMAGKVASPKVLKAIKASGISTPDFNLKSPSLKVSYSVISCILK